MKNVFCRILLFLAAAVLLSGSARAQDHLIFCNNPEKLRLPGGYGNAFLKAGETYTIFYHFKNVSRTTGPLVIGLRGAEGNPLRFTVRQGTATPQRDPSQAGKQAMARYLSAPEKPMIGKKGYARFAYSLASGKVASGVLTVRCKTDARLRIYFRHDRWSAPGAHTITVTAPRREIEIALSSGSRTQFYRIGEPEKGMSRHLDGTYGMLYAFRIAVPEGRKVRVAFSPRGGKSGLVGSVNGNLRQSPIIPATHWRVFCETISRNGSVNLITSPFGGVFYPVEIMFQLL